MIRRRIETPQLRAVRSRRRSLTRCRAFGSIRTLTSPPRKRKPNPGKVRLLARSTVDFLAVDAQLEALLDELRDARHDTLARPPTSDVDHHVVGLAHEPVPTPFQL
jgi:hypothetical protein